MYRDTYPRSTQCYRIFLTLLIIPTIIPSTHRPHKPPSPSTPTTAPAPSNHRANLNPPAPLPVSQPSPPSPPPIPSLTPTDSSRPFFSGFPKKGKRLFLIGKKRSFKKMRSYQRRKQVFGDQPGSGLTNEPICIEIQVFGDLPVSELTNEPIHIGDHPV